MEDIDLKDIIPKDLNEIFLNEEIYTLKVDNTGKTYINIDGEKLTRALIPQQEVSKYTLQIDVSSASLILDKKQKFIFEEYIQS